MSLKYFDCREAARKFFLGRLGGPGHAPPENFENLTSQIGQKLLFRALGHAFSSNKVMSPELFIILNWKDFTWKNKRKKSASVRGEYSETKVVSAERLLTDW